MFALKTIGEMSAAFSCPSLLKHSDLVLVHTGSLYLEDNLTLNWEGRWDDGGIVATLSVLSHKRASARLGRWSKHTRPLHR